MKSKSKSFLIATYSKNEKTKVEMAVKEAIKSANKKWEELYGKKLIEG